MNNSNLKKFASTLFLILVLGIFSIPVVLGQSKSASSSSNVSPTVNVDEKAIQDFKEKVATKVAELQAQNNKAVSGFVNNISGSTLTIKDENDVAYEIKPDESIAKYYQVVGNQRKEIQLSDIKKGSFIIVMGVANDMVINANSIYVDEMFLVKSGKITQVDNTNFALKVLSSDKDTYTLNIETSSKQQMINVKTLEEEKIGFSKIKEGDTIHFVVKKTGTEKDNTYSAVKILIIPQEYFMK